MFAWVGSQYLELILVVNCEENGKQGRIRYIGLSYATGSTLYYFLIEREFVLVYIRECANGKADEKQFCQSILSSLEVGSAEDWNCEKG